MRKRILAFFRQLQAEQKGAVFTMVAAAIFGITGVGALVVDIGSILYWQRVLQTTADAAALAGAQDIGVGGTPIATAVSYSAVAGNKNAHANFTVTMISGYPQLKCFTTIGLACTTNQTPATSANGIQVQEQAAVRLYFARIFGLASVKITATSTAAASGGVPIPLNVAFVLDTTASMNNPATDKSCKNSALNCALNGIQVLLGELWPCQQSQTCTALGATPVDGASLFVFPPVTNSNQSSCARYQLHQSYNFTIIFRRFEHHQQRHPDHQPYASFSYEYDNTNRLQHRLMGRGDGCHTYKRSDASRNRYSTLQVRHNYNRCRHRVGGPVDPGFDDHQRSSIPH
jgi:hypothetical protein